jgi:hypothetical protein
MPALSTRINRAIKSSPPANVVKRLLYGRFHAMQHATHGMLSPAVYRMIYEQVRAAPGLDTIEIGGASGSGSIAAAWGKIDGNHASKHIVVEKLEGGSRGRYGTFEDNLARFNGLLDRFGATDKVTLFPHHLTRENAPEVVRLVGTERIAGFILDADGRIDRDFEFFLPLIHPQGFIIVDDYHPTRSWKHALTFRLLNQFADWRLFILDQVRAGTAFGRPHPEADATRIDPDVFADIIDGIRRDFQVADRIADLYFRHSRTAPAG